MTLPFTQSLQKMGPIKVFQNNDHFLVSIHPENRERAKKISGRQWDGERRAWIYPKDLSTYNALVAEFQNDADMFNILPPKIKHSPNIGTPANEMYGDEFEEFMCEEIPCEFYEDDFNDISQDQDHIDNELKQIYEILESVKDLTLSQNRDLEELREHQNETATIVKKFKLPTKKTIKTEKIEVLPESLNLDKRHEIYLIEQALLTIAYETSGESKSFLKWMESYSPLESPVDFVSNTHEMLKEMLEKIVLGEADSEASFSDLIYKAEKDKLIYSHHHDPIRVYPILRIMNNMRNLVTHARGFQRSEYLSRSIIYLMNFALVWPKMIMIAENGHE